MPKIVLALLFLLCFLQLPAQQPNAEPELRFTPGIITIYYKLGESTIPLKVYKYGETGNAVCINLHSNEETSIQAASSVLETRGGTLIRIENNQQRTIRFRLRGQYYTFDPNRIFSRTGIEQNLRENHRFSVHAVKEIEKFAERILQLIPDPNSCIIALHNNTNDAFGIGSYLPGNTRQGDAKAVYANEKEDVDDLALTTDSLLYQHMVANNYNAIWQDNRKARRDGSLSIFCGERNLRYINIETEHGKVSKYVEMLERFLDILEVLKGKNN